MSREELEAKIRKIPLKERIKTCQKMIGSMCSQGRPPKMSIPVNSEDEDFFIVTTLRDVEIFLRDV